MSAWPASRLVLVVSKLPQTPGLGLQQVTGLLTSPLVLCQSVLIRVLLLRHGGKRPLQLRVILPSRSFGHLVMQSKSMSNMNGDVPVFGPSQRGVLTDTEAPRNATLPGSLDMAQNTNYILKASWLC